MNSTNSDKRNPCSIGKCSRGLFGTLLVSKQTQMIRDRFYILPLSSRTPVLRSQEELAADNDFARLTKAILSK